MVGLLPAANTDENVAEDEADDREAAFWRRHTVCVRNELLVLVDELTSTSAARSDELQRLLGYDWLLLFMDARRVHASTAVRACRLLCAQLLAAPQNAARFKEGAFFGKPICLARLFCKKIDALKLRLQDQRLKPKESKLHNEYSYPFPSHFNLSFSFSDTNSRAHVIRTG